MSEGEPPALLPRRFVGSSGLSSPGYSSIRRLRIERNSVSAKELPTSQGRRVAEQGLKYSRRRKMFQQKSSHFDGGPRRRNDSSFSSSKALPAMVSPVASCTTCTAAQERSGQCQR